MFCGSGAGVRASEGRELGMQKEGELEGSCQNIVRSVVDVSASPEFRKTAFLPSRASPP